MVPAAGGGDGGRGAGGGRAAVHAAHGAGPRSPAAGHGAGLAREVSPEEGGRDPEAAARGRVEVEVVGASKVKLRWASAREGNGEAKARRGSLHGTGLVASGTGTL